MHVLALQLSLCLKMCCEGLFGIHEDRIATTAVYERSGELHLTTTRVHLEISNNYKEEKTK